MSGSHFGAGSGSGSHFGVGQLLSGTSLSSNPLGVPPTYFNLSAVSISDDLTVGSVVATISGSGDAPVTYSIVSDPDSKFVLAANGTDILLEAAVDYDVKQFHDLEIRAENAAGFCGATARMNVTRAVAVDNTAPVISLSDPLDDATNVPVNAVFTITYSEPIRVGSSGTITLHRDNGGWGVHETFDVATDVGTGLGQIEISGNDLIIRPGADLPNSGDFAVQISGTAIEDLAGNAFAGIGDFTTLNFSTAAAAGPRASTTLGTSIDQDGVTFRFFTDMTLATPIAVPVGRTVGNGPFSLSDRSYVVAQITPADGDLQADGQIGNGAMKDPFIDKPGTTTTFEQGFDQYMEVPGGTGPAAALTAYNDALNVRAVQITPGQQTSIVKSVRNGVVTNSTWQIIDKYVTLNVLSEAPYADALPPAPSGLTKTMARTSEINWNALPSLDLASIGFPTLAETTSKVPSNLGIFGNLASGGEELRRYRLDVALGLTSSNYSGHIADDYAKACISLYDNRYTNAEKADFLYKVIGFGKQIDACYQRCNDVNFLFSGAGQGMAWYPFWVITGFVLGDAAMLGRAIAAKTQMDQSEWVTQAMIDGATLQGDNPNQAQAFLQEMLGMAMIDPTGTSSNFDSRYGEIARTGNAWEWLAIAFLQNGPAGATGVSWRLNGGNYDSSNPKAAVIGVSDRLRHVVPSPVLYDPGDVWRNLYDLAVDTLGLWTPWTGVPDQPHLGNQAGYHGLDGDYFTGGNGQITWDFSAKGEYSSQAITDRAVAYSLDGRQWEVTEGVGNTGTISNLMHGQWYFCRYRVRNADGWGPWSQSYIKNSPTDPTANPAWATATAYTQGNLVYIPADDLVYRCLVAHTSGTFATDLGSGRWVIAYDQHYRNRAKTTGSEANTAPSNTSAPQMLELDRTNWDPVPGNWKVVAGDQSALLSVAGKTYAAGLGDWQGFPAPGYSFEWFLNGVSVGTDPTYTPPDDDLPLRCRVRADNGVGAPVDIVIGNPNVIVPSNLVVQATTFNDGAWNLVHEFTYPATVAAGNTLVFGIFTSEDTGDLTPPADITQVDRVGRMHVFQKEAADVDGTEGGTTISWSHVGGSSTSGIAFFEFEGDGTVEATITALSDDPPARAPSDGAGEYGFAAISGTQRTSTDPSGPPANYTACSPLFAESAAGSNSGGHSTIAGAYRTHTIATSEDPADFDWSAGTFNGAAATVSFKPAP